MNDGDLFKNSNKRNESTLVFNQLKPVIYYLIDGRVSSIGGKLRGDFLGIQ